METVNITKEEFYGLIPLKRNIVYTDKKLVYKKSMFSLKNIDDLELLIEINNIDIPSLVFPINKLNIEGEPGYITKYYQNYYPREIAFKKDKYHFSDKYKIIKLLIDAVKDMHQAHIVHGDLHSGNIIFNKKDLKIIDFDNMRIEDFSSNYNVYRYKKLRDIKCLVINILSILSESNELNIDFKIIPFIELLNISDEFKKYLNLCIFEKEDILDFYPDTFLNEINGEVEKKAKNLVKGLK